MPRDTSQTPTDHGMTLEKMQAIGERAEKIKRATQKLRDAEERLEFLKRHTVEREDFTVKMSWSPQIILKKGGTGYGHGRDITFKVRIPYAIVEQQVVDDIKRAKRELILLGGRP